jgi:hypothetical protein
MVGMASQALEGKNTVLNSKKGRTYDRRRSFQGHWKGTQILVYRDKTVSKYTLGIITPVQ